MLYQAVWFYYCSMCSRKCPFQHSCLLNYVVRKERRSHRGSPRSESGNKYHGSWGRGSVGLEESIWAGETDCSWVWHWAKNAKNNKKAATQGKCPRVLLAKSCVSPSYWSYNSRNEWQALITGGSLHRPVTSPNKTARIKQRRPRQDVCGAQEQSDRQESKTTSCCGGKQSGCIQLENDQQL